jgi:phospholipase/carboxylesterase
MSQAISFSRVADIDILATAIVPDKPSVILMHGYGADHNDLAPLAGILDRDSNYNWIFPNALIELPMSFFGSGRAWFNLDIQTIEQRFIPGSPHNFADYLPQGLDEAAQSIQKLVRGLKLDEKNIILGGFSQGAMVSCHAALTKFSQIKGLLQLSTTLIAKKLWQSKLEEKAEFKLFQSHGTNDPVLPFEAAKQLNDIFSQSLDHSEFHPFHGGHEIPQPVIEALNFFLSRQT